LGTDSERRMETLGQRVCFYVLFLPTGPRKASVHRPCNGTLLGGFVALTVMCSTTPDSYQCSFAFRRFSIFVRSFLPSTRHGCIGIGVRERASTSFPPFVVMLELLHRCKKPSDTFRSIGTFLYFRSCRLPKYGVEFHSYFTLVATVLV